VEIFVVLLRIRVLTTVVVLTVHASALLQMLQLVETAFSKAKD
jgi:hypothetical protein